MIPITYHSTDVNGLKVFYRESGPSDAPKLLLHGYPEFQHYFRTHQPPLLAIWGRNDPFFLPAGAEAFKRDWRVRRRWLASRSSVPGGDTP